MAMSIGLVVVVWAVNFIAAKIGLRYLPPVTMASFRVVIAGLSMVPAYLICSRMPAFADARRARLHGPKPRDLWTFSYLGFFGVVVNQMCFTMGLRYTSVSHAAVIVGMGPIYTLVLAVLFRLERATWHKVVGMAIAFRDVCGAREAGGGALRRVDDDGVQSLRRCAHYFAGGFASGVGAGTVFEVARDSVAGMDGAAVHGGLQFGDGISFLFLAAAVLGSFAVERVHVFAAGAGGDLGDFVAG